MPGLTVRACGMHSSAVGSGRRQLETVRGLASVDVRVYPPGVFFFRGKRSLLLSFCQTTTQRIFLTFVPYHNARSAVLFWERSLFSPLILAPGIHLHPKSQSLIRSLIPANCQYASVTSPFQVKLREHACQQCSGYICPSFFYSGKRSLFHFLSGDTCTTTCHNSTVFF